MSEASNHIPETWLSKIGGRDASGWLHTFAESPRRAVADLLWDAFYFGPLNLTDRSQLLAGWLDLLGNSESFADRLDAELTAWVEQNWGQFERRAETLASAWSCLCNVVEFSAKLHEESELKNCAAALRARFDQRQRFLGSFSYAPAADPLGLYLGVVAEFQGDDRSLIAFWHNMCDLPDGVPFYHARYAMLGLRRIKAADPAENGTLRTEVVLGLIRLAEAFDRLARERKLRDDLAESTFLRVASQTAAAYPGSIGWRKQIPSRASELPERALGWLVKAVPPLAEAVRQAKTRQSGGAPRRHTAIEPDPTWFKRIGELVSRLASGDRNCLPEVERLLAEQRRYAEATGVTYNIVRTLCYFASRVLKFSPRRALLWANEAREWEPNNDYTWNTVRTVLLQLPEWQNVVLSFAWVAWKRFPADAVAHAGLAEALKAARRYREAEAIYRLTIERFPKDSVARDGLANILVTMGRTGEAIEEYRRNIKLGYADSTTYTALAQLLRRRGEAGREEALQLIRKALDLSPDSRIARALEQELLTGREVSVQETVDKWEDIAADSLDSITLPTADGGEWDVEQEAIHLPRLEETQPVVEPVETLESAEEARPDGEDARGVAAQAEQQTSAESNVEPEAEPTVEPKAEPTVVQTVEPPAERKAEPDIAHVEQKVEPHVARMEEKAEENIERIEQQAVEDVEQQAVENVERKAEPIVKAEPIIDAEGDRPARRADHDVRADEPEAMETAEAEQPRAVVEPETELAPEAKATESVEPVVETKAEAEVVEKVSPDTEAEAVKKVTPDVGRWTYRAGKGAAGRERETVKPVVAKQPDPPVERQEAGEKAQETDSVGGEAQAAPPEVVELSGAEHAEVVTEQPGAAVVEPEAPKAQPAATLTGKPDSQRFQVSDGLLIAALVAEAYFYRIWSKGAERNLAFARRRRAAELLARAERMFPQDAQVLAEKAALLADEGNESAAFKYLTAHLSSHAAAAPLLVLKARLDRERAREQKRRLDKGALAELCIYPQRLRELDPVLSPLFHFQRGLAALALLDGDERKKAAADSFSSFRKKLAYSAALERREREAAVNRHDSEVPRFHEWLQTHINSRVFVGLAETESVGLNDIPLLDATWERRRPAIEEVEDVFADRVTYGAV